MEAALTVAAHNGALQRLARQMGNESNQIGLAPREASLSFDKADAALRREAPDPVASRTASAAVQYRDHAALDIKCMARRHLSTISCL